VLAALVLVAAYPAMATDPPPPFSACRDARSAAKAHALRKDDPSLAAMEAPRLARLADVAQGAAR
jgi:hypothetical protein